MHLYVNNSFSQDCFFRFYTYRKAARGWAVCIVGGCFADATSVTYCRSSVFFIAVAK